MRTAFGIATAALLLGMASAARAQPSVGYKKVAIQKRKYILANEIKLSLGSLPVDPFEKGLAASLSYTRHLNQYWAWEVLSTSAAFYLYDTSTKENLVNQFGRDPNNFAGPRLIITSGIELTPLYGKLAFLNDGLVHNSLLVGAYAGVIFGDRENFSGDGATTLSDFRPSIGPGIGYRVYFSQNLSARLDWRTFFSLKQGFDSPELDGEEPGLTVSMLINLSLSWNFGADV